MVDYCVPLGDLSYLFWIAVSLMFVFVAIAFMIARGLQRKEIEALARDEFRQVLISVVISLSVVGLASGFCYLSGVMMQDISPNQTMFQYAGTYLSVLVNNIGIPVIKNLWSFSYFSTLISTQGPVEFKGGNMMEGASLISTAADSINGFIFIPLISSLNIQLIILQAAEAFAFTLILPCGMILRVLRPTRAAGCFLIAVSFAAFVVLPLTYVINYQITEKIFPDFSKGIELKTLTFADLASNPLNIYQFLTDWLLQCVDKGAIILPQAVILPIFSLTITATFIGAFTEFLKDLR